MGNYSFWAIAQPLKVVFFKWGLSLETIEAFNFPLGSIVIKQVSGRDFAHYEWEPLNMVNEINPSALALNHQILL